MFRIFKRPQKPIVAEVRLVTKLESKELFDTLMTLYHAGYSSGWSHNPRWKGTPKRVADTHQRIKDLLRVKVERQP